MNLVVTGKQLELTEALKELVEQETSFLKEILPQGKTVTVTLEALPVQKASILFYHENEVVRLEQTGRDLYVLFPQLAKRLKKHMRGVESLKRVFKKDKALDETPMSPDEEILQDVELGTSVTKRKRFEMKPMSEKEAILQMKMLNHEQFIFANADLQNTICLLYTRKDGDFGVIETTY